MSFTQWEMWGIACMAVVTVLRVPAAVRFREQRGLWLAMAAATVSMSFHIRAVSDLIDQFLGVSHWTDLFRHLCGLITVTAVLNFVIHVTDIRRLIRVVYSVAVAVAVTLVGLDIFAGPHTRNNLLRSELTASWMTQFYWWILLDAHFWMNMVCIWACWRHSRLPTPPYLRVALRLFGLGMAFSAVYMMTSMAYVAFRWSLTPTLLPALGAGEAVFMAAGTAVPLILATRLAGHEAIALYQLHPLWRIVVQATPEVTFPGTVPHGRVRDLLTSLPQIHAKLYRQIIEIRDALLILSRYVTPDTVRQAREHVSSHSVPAALAEATVTACFLEAALHAKISENIPCRTGNTISDHGGSDRGSEIRWLCLVAQAHRGPVIQAFTDTLHRSRDNDGEGTHLDLSQNHAL
jgi:hypothetical protein